MGTFLGTILDRKLDWKEQVDRVCNKLNRFSYALYKLTKIASRNTALKAYCAYVESVLRYALVTWGNSSECNKAIIAQKKCIRAICNCAPDQSCKPLFQYLKILPLPCLYIFEVAKFVKQNDCCFKQAKDICTRNTRNGNRLMFDAVPKTVRLTKNCPFMSILIYNKLPTFIKTYLGINLKKLCIIG